MAIKTSMFDVAVAIEMLNVAITIETSMIDAEVVIKTTLDVEKLLSSCLSPIQTLVH